MTKKIFQSIMLTAGAVLLASLIIILGCLYDYFQGVQQDQLEDELSLAAQAVELSGSDYLEGLDSQTYRLTWITADGKVLCDTRTDAETMENHADREEVREALESGSGESSRYSQTLLEKTLYRACRLSDGTVLRISVSRSTLGVLIVGMLQPIVLVLLAALILAYVLARRVSRRIVAPLEALDLEAPLENDTYEELSPLLNRINRQRRQIDGQLETLRQKNDEFAQITRSMKEGLVLLNEKGTILSINPAAQKLFRTDRSCLEQDFLTVERSPEISAAIRSALNSGHSEYRLQRGGREYQLDISRIESGGKTAGAVLLSFDVTEQAFAERNRREFTANVSHELKTPLQSILGSAELLENGMVKAEDVPRFVGRIRTEAARLVELIEDILRLSRLDEGGPMPYETVDLFDLAKETAASLQDAAAEKNVRLTVSGDTAPIYSVPRLLTETIRNLCDNAIKYNVDGGTAEVLVEPSETCVTLTVRDSGIGIPPEHQERVFERFYRVDKSHCKTSGGTGLGLSIVKHAVQSLGGRIELDSVPGHGTTVSVTLPKPTAGSLAANTDS